MVSVKTSSNIRGGFDTFHANNGNHNDWFTHMFKTRLFSFTDFNHRMGYDGGNNIKEGIIFHISVVIQ